MSALRLWIDGKIVPASRAVISASDPAVQSGQGLFEVIRGYEGVPFLLDRHIKRMRKSARHFGFKLRWSDSAIEKAVRELLRVNRIADAYIRLLLTGSGSLLILAKKRTPLPASWYKTGAAVRFAPFRRDPAGPLFGHKTLNYLENILTHEAARKEGYADALFRSIDGRVLEGCVTNVFLVKDGVLRTPELKGVLPGVTRQVGLELAKRQGMKVLEGFVTPRDLEHADELFLTNALVEILPVARVEGLRIGPPGPVTKSLMTGCRRLVDATAGRKT
jgi:branched-subunit amino acid aminotransferase/4-amino-4-deoxychorismate lyase